LFSLLFALGHVAHSESPTSDLKRPTMQLTHSPPSVLYLPLEHLQFAIDVGSTPLSKDIHCLQTKSTYKVIGDFLTWISDMPNSLSASVISGTKLSNACISVSGDQVRQV
jgi:hypothetical protein